MIEERLVEVETRVAYQDQMVETLNETIYQQDIRLQKLEKMVQHLGQQLLDYTEGMPTAEIDDEPPPHY